jgi:hypothetical protein
MLEREVEILSIVVCGCNRYLIVSVGNTNAVLKCLLTDDFKDTRDLPVVGETVRVCVQSISFERSEPVILVSLVDYSPRKAEAEACSPAFSDLREGVATPSGRKRMFFDLIQDYC